MRHRPQRVCADPAAAPALMPILKGHMMKRLACLALLALTPVAALAQDAAQTAATALITPMLDEIAPGAPGVALTTCVIGNATPEEIATMAAATGPDDAIGALVTEILARQPTIDCATAALGG
jgi:hypothetical protein